MLTMLHCFAYIAEKPPAKSLCFRVHCSWNMSYSKPKACCRFPCWQLHNCVIYSSRYT